MPILNWLTRDEDIRAASCVPYRLLEEAPDMSTGDPNTGNLLIYGDNLDALKALLPFYAGRVKCIYIDPPYNTRAAFEHYDDNLEHSKWLAMMWPRLELLRELLAEDGSIWVSIDDNEGHYLKVIMDEVFGRGNFIANFVWQKKYTRANDAQFVSDNHDHLICFVKNVAKASFNGLSRNEKQNKAYKNPDNDLRGPWKATPLHAKSGTPNNQYEYTFSNGVVWKPPLGTYHRFSKEKLEELDRSGQLWFGRTGRSIPARKSYLSEVKQTIVPVTVWLHDEVGSNHDAKNEIRNIFEDLYFDTPKPERLLMRVLEIATNPGDLVLDSFLGSGTTAAVAHKMGRRYIGIEMGEHAVSHCVPRLRKVIEGEQGGISKSVNWQGGGGFRFYRLGPPVFDEDGQIRADIQFSVLAAHVYFSESGHPWNGTGDSPFLGLHDGRAYALLYNGILGDKRPGGGNVLTRATLVHIREEISKAHPDADGPLTVYGEQSRLMPQTLEREGIIFKQTPYDVKARM